MNDLLLIFKPNTLDLVIALTIIFFATISRLALKKQPNKAQLEIPKPLTEPLGEGDLYYVVDLLSSIGYSRAHWSGHAGDYRFLELGIAHRTIHNAIAHYKVIESINKANKGNGTRI